MRLRPPDPPGSFRLAALHLAGLSALAVAQPLFDLLSRNVEFFAVRGSTRWDVVLFALGIVVLPPLVLLGLETLLGLAGSRAATVLHLAFLAALLALLSLQALRGIGVGAVALAAALGGLGALLYVRARAARMVLSVVGAAPLLVLVLFLAFSPVSRLLESPPEPRLAQVPSGAPVVMVVLDELPTVSLLREDGELDAVRYPSFARLAEDATWFRNATTVHEWTTGAVPPMLTGQQPDGLPLFLDHPNNLFTLLGGAYDLNVHESQTHLCPPELCDPDREPLPERVGSLLSDLSVVYGHLVLPAGLADELPSISTAWRDFGGGDGPQALLQEGPAQAGQRPAAYTERDAEVQAFVDSLAASERPTLSFLHVLLPHHPWEYLPDGRVYASDLGFQPGLVNEGWVGDPELAIQAQQRHLLQVGYTDLALGRILDQLEETGVYDESLVVVVADHGVSFRPDGERRRVEPGNMEEIAFVPLFVKSPGQARGEIVDGAARTTDIVPTIADLLGIEVPWELDGRSLAAAGSGDGEVAVGTSAGEVVEGELAELVERRNEALARQVELFGDEDDRPGLFGIGPRPELLGRPVDGLAAAAGGPTFERYGTSDYDPASAFAPVRVYGRIHGAPAGEDIAIAVNGRIVAVTRSFEHDGETLLSAVTPPDAYEPGANSVRVYVATGSGGGTVLEELLPTP